MAGNSVKAIKKKFKMLSGYLQERTVRAWAAAEALGIGRGGISAVAAATGLSRTTVHTAVNELLSKPAVRPDMIARQRKPGGGRQPDQPTYGLRFAGRNGLQSAECAQEP